MMTTMAAAAAMMMMMNSIQNNSHVHYNTSVRNFWACTKHKPF
jgi:hypothetical protein